MLFLQKLCLEPPIGTGIIDAVLGFPVVKAIGTAADGDNRR